MFVEVADATCLRQGDILEGIPFPRFSMSEVHFLATADNAQSVPALKAKTHTHRDDQNWLTAQVPVRVSFFAVLSQCCHLEPKNGQILMPAFSMARLVAIPKTIAADAQRLASVRANKDPRITADPGYVNYFYIPANVRLDGQEWLVDFNQTVAIPGREFPSILTKKILQMDDRNRVKFKIKLAACLTRLTDEERAAGLENPWIEG